MSENKGHDAAGDAERFPTSEQIEAAAKAIANNSGQHSGIWESPTIQGQARAALSSLAPFVQYLRALIPSSPPGSPARVDTERELELRQRVAELERDLARVLGEAQESARLVSNEYEAVIGHFTEDLEAARGGNGPLSERATELAGPSSPDAQPQAERVVELTVERSQLCREVERLESELSAARTELEQLRGEHGPATCYSAQGAHDLRTELAAAQAERDEAVAARDAANEQTGEFAVNEERLIAELAAYREDTTKLVEENSRLMDHIEEQLKQDGDTHTNWHFACVTAREDRDHARALLRGMARRLTQQRRALNDLLLKAYNDRHRFLSDLDAARTELDKEREHRREFEFAEMLTHQECPKKKHPDWFMDTEYNHLCPWCEVEEARQDAVRNALDAASALTELAEAQRKVTLSVAIERKLGEKLADAQKTIRAFVRST